MLEEGGNWTHSNFTRVAVDAAELDNTRPQMAHTQTSQNRELTDFLGRTEWLNPEYWREVGLGETSMELVKFVPRSMRGRGQRLVQQTEFWKFAKRLESKGDETRAQQIRTQMTVNSLGIIAQGLGIHPSYPTSVSRSVDRTHRTVSPFQTLTDRVVFDSATVEGSVADGHMRLFSVVASLTPEQVWTIRRSEPFDTFVRGYFGSNSDNDVVEARRKLRVLETYLYEFLVPLGVSMLGRQDEWETVRLRSRLLGYAKYMLSPAVGIVTRVAGLDGALADLPSPVPDEIVPLEDALPSLATFASLVLWGSKTRTQRRNLEDTARATALSEIDQMRREPGLVHVELYGPVNAAYWTGPESSK